MSLSYLFIVNPNSNSGKTAKKWSKVFFPQIQKLVPKCAWSFTQEKGDAAFIAHYAKKLQFDVIVAVGGDGTINEIVNGLLDQTLNHQIKNKIFPKIFGFLPQQTPGEGKIPALGFIPAGTGCDFIKSLYIPSNFDKALKILLANKRQYSNIGKIHFTVHKENPLSHFRYFINIASCGISAKTVWRVSKSKKILGAKISFLIAGIITCFKNNSNNVLIYYDNQLPRELNLLNLFVCNGVYCGGGLKVAPEAHITDGLFHTNEIKRMSRIKMLFMSHRLISGNYIGVENIISLKTAKKVHIEPNQQEDILIECDGELPGMIPAEYTIADKNIEVIC